MLLFSPFFFCLFSDKKKERTDSFSNHSPLSLSQNIMKHTHTHTDVADDNGLIFVEPEIVEPERMFNPFSTMNAMMNRMHSLMGSFDENDADVSVIKIETSVPDNGVFRFRSSINFGDSDSFFTPRPWTTLMAGNDDAASWCACMLRRFQGLVNNQMNRLLDIMRQVHENYDKVNVYALDDEEEEEETQEEPVLEERFKQVEEEEEDPTGPSVNDLEEEEYLSSQGFLQADWGVNVLELQRACQADFENYCPDSVPRVFYDDAIPRYPPVDIPHDGLAPVKDDAPCWMKCAATHQSELTYECDVASQRMYDWLKEHDGDLEYMESPQLMMFSAFVHFLLLLLILLTCIRCTRVFVRVRRKRCAERRRAALLQAKVPVVKAITIQIPPTLKKEEEVEDVPIVVRGTEVSVESV